MANEAPDLEPVEEATPRLVDRIDSRIVNFLTVVGFGVPILVYFGVISVYSTNVILEDQLTDVPIIRASYVHLFPWGVLWRPYNEDRSFFPNLVVVLLAHLDHFDVTAEEYLGGVLLVAALVVLVRAHRRRSSEVPWLYYCPVFILVLSVVQYDTMLLGGVSWYLVALALAVAVSLLDRLELTWPVFVGALAAAVVGSFSAFAGLLIWPVGLFVLLVRRRPIRWTVAWIAVGAVTAAAYFHGLHNTGNSAGHPGYVLHHPATAVQFFLVTIGDPLGFFAGFIRADTNILLFGTAVLALSVYALVTRLRRQEGAGGATVGLSMIVFGMLFAGTVVLARTDQGYWTASSSRYTTYSLVLLAGVYLALLDGPRVRVLGRRRAGPAAAGGLDRRTMGPAAWLAVSAWCLVLVMIVVQAVLGYQDGIVGAEKTRRIQQEALVVSETIDRQPDTTVTRALEGLFTATYIREQVATERRLRLAFFATRTHGHGPRRPPGAGGG